MKPEVERILNSIDLEDVNKAILDTGIAPWDVDSIVGRVLLATDLWLLDDLQAERILVEQEYNLKSKGILDLTLINDIKGETGIVDWKTTQNLKRPNFVEETKNEFQASLYLAHGGDWLEREYGIRPTYIEFRALDEAGEFKSFRVPWTESTRRDADEQLYSVSELYETLIGEEFDHTYDGPWARNRPRACFSGSKSGPTCPFFRDCTEMTMPFGVGLKTHEELVQLTPRSKSSMKSFLECPERFRRTKILGAPFVSNDAIKAGEAFHAGMESIYNQALARR